MKWNIKNLEEFGRTRLSDHFCMREMLYSEIAQVNGFLNAPDDPELAIYAGSHLCEKILEPIQGCEGRMNSTLRMPPLVGPDSSGQVVE